MKSSIISIIGVVVTFASLTTAATIQLGPQITSPRLGSIWRIGTIQTVTWDTTSLLPSVKDNFAAIFLERSGILLVRLNGTFLIGKGSGQVAVPWVANGSDYRILFDDGLSAEFSIF